MKGTFKKILAVSIAAAMAFTAMPLAVNAEENIGESKVFNFDVKSCGWEDVAADGVYCHIYHDKGKGKFPAWQSMAEKCTYDESTGIATYDIKTGVDKGYTDLELIGENNEWCIIFSTKSGNQTNPTVLNSTCYGDTLYQPDDVKYDDGLVDSAKKSAIVKWKNSGLGAPLWISLDGKIEGETLLYGETKEGILAEYIIRYYDDEEKMADVQMYLNRFNLQPDAVFAEVKKQTLFIHIREAAEEILNKTTPPIPTVTEKVLSFDIGSFGWKDYAQSGSVYCHIYSADGTGEFPAWQSKIEKCEYNPETGIATYDLNTAIKEGYTDFENINYKNNWLVRLSIDPSSEYGNVTYQSFPAVLNASCYGDTLYAPDPKDGYLGYGIGGTNLVYAEWKNNTNLGAPMHSKSLFEIAGKTLLEDEPIQNVLAMHALRYLDSENLREAIQFHIDEYNVSTVDLIFAVYVVADKYALDNGLDEDTVEEMCNKAEYVISACVDPTIDIKDKVFYIDVKSLGWECPADEEFYCHMYRVVGEAETPNWMSNYTKCEYDSETGIAKYEITTATEAGYNDLAKIGGENEWMMIFHSKSGNRAYEVFVSSDCFGDTLYAPDNEDVYPYPDLAPTDDPNRNGMVLVEWKNSFGGGPLLVTPEGDIYGYDVAYGESDTSVLAEYMVAYTVYDAGFIDNIEHVQKVVDFLSIDLSEILIEVEKEIESYVAEEIIDTQNAETVYNKISKVLSECKNPIWKYVGDVDNDGEFKIQDVTLLQRYLADLTDLDLNQRNSADANQDERVDVQDVTLLQRILAGAI